MSIIYKAVSYTHLDVYKRQAIEDAVSSMTTLNKAASEISYAFDIHAVSYTHLCEVQHLFLGRSGTDG